MLAVGIDIGGTFTDIILLDTESGEPSIGKVLTTAKDPSIGSVNGLAALLQGRGLNAGALRHIIHGTTLVANALIERKGAKTALITTRGFRDILEIGREKRYDMYDLLLEMPEPLVPRYLRREVSERLYEDGTVVTPVDEAEARGVAADLKRQGVEAIAVCFLHAFRNPAHEQRMRTLIGEAFPEAVVSLSTEVVPEIREYERTSTTVANAYTQPLTQRYLTQMEQALRQLGFPGELIIMLSSGGITNLETAKRFPIRLVESGPAAGAIAATFYGEITGEHRLLSFDMGGTTAKICLIEEGKPLTTTDFEVAKAYRFKKGSGLPVRIPVIEMVEIGAGGGSIAHIDEMGLLKVGPESASSEPGPACYNLGGEEPTVTDADLVLGYLNPDFFLGGEMALNLDKARQAIAERIAQPLGLTPARAAWGIHQVVDENMANAARLHAVERGQDLQSHTLVAFGGAGPVHAYWVAQRLGMGRILYPLGAGVTSAFGFLIAPPSFDFVRTYVERLDPHDLDLKVLNRLFAEMEEEGKTLLKGVGVPEGQVQLSRLADMCYVGQGHEIPIPIPSGLLRESDLPTIEAAFASEYKRLYQRTNPDLKIRGINWRVVASGPRPTLKMKRLNHKGRQRIDDSRKGNRPVYVPERGDYVDCPVYDRYRLFPGATFSGPAIIEERESTVVVGLEGQVTTDEHLNLLVTLGVRR